MTGLKQATSRSSGWLSALELDFVIRFRLTTDIELQRLFQFDPNTAQDLRPQCAGVVCNWCTYTAADLAGTSRLIQPPNLRMIRMMCTGMVDPKYVIKALLEGADAVLVSGCHPGDCHYINGNLKARRRIKLLKEILPRFGFDERRLKMTWIGASEGIDFADTVRHMVADVKALGQNDLRTRMVL